MNSPSAMKVYKVVEVEIEGLGADIEAARRQDPRSLKDICEAANGMSPVNWSRIEKEQQRLPVETLRTIEKVLDKDFGVVVPGEDG